MRISKIIVSCAVLALTAQTQTHQNAEGDLATIVDHLLTAAFESDSLGLVKSIGETARFTNDADVGYLAHYYIAFAKWQQVLIQTNPAVNPEWSARLLHEALGELNRCVALKEDFADAYALSINCWYPLYTFEPQLRLEHAARIAIVIITLMFASEEYFCSIRLNCDIKDLFLRCNNHPHPVTINHDSTPLPE